MGRHRDKAKEIISNLDKYNSTPDQLLTQLDELQRRCTEGYQQERQTAKGTVVSLTEVDLKNAVSCINAKWDIVKNLVAMAEADGDEPRDYQFELHVITAPPSAPRESSEPFED
jgi:hypothetical protein